MILKYGLRTYLYSSNSFLYERQCTVRLPFVNCLYERIAVVNGIDVTGELILIYFPKDSILFFLEFLFYFFLKILFYFQRNQEILNESIFIQILSGNFNRNLISKFFIKLLYYQRIFNRTQFSIIFETN